MFDTAWASPRSRRSPSVRDVMGSVTALTMPMIATTPRISTIV
jgi:hypothetical protein